MGPSAGKAMEITKTSKFMFKALPTGVTDVDKVHLYP